MPDEIVGLPEASVALIARGGDEVSWVLFQNVIRYLRSLLVNLPADPAAEGLHNVLGQVLGKLDCGLEPLITDRTLVEGNSVVELAHVGLEVRFLVE